MYPVCLLSAESMSEFVTVARQAVRCHCMNSRYSPIAEFLTCLRFNLIFVWNLLHEMRHLTSCTQFQRGNVGLMVLRCIHLVHATIGDVTLALSINVQRSYLGITYLMPSHKNWVRDHFITFLWLLVQSVFNLVMKLQSIWITFKL
jgi:hypothetical protein